MLKRTFALFGERMPKRYPEWMFKDNVPKPRTTQIRHAKQAAQTLDVIQDSIVGQHSVEPGDRVYSELSSDEETDIRDSCSSSVNNVHINTLRKTPYNSSSDDEPSDAFGSTVDNMDSAGSLPEGQRPGGVHSDSSDFLTGTGDDEVIPADNCATSELDELLYPGSRLTLGESMMLILGHSLRHHSTKEGTESLLQLIEAHLPKEAAIATSKYLFF